MWMYCQRYCYYRYPQKSWFGIQQYLIIPVKLVYHDTCVINVTMFHTMPCLCQVWTWVWPPSTWLRSHPRRSVGRSELVTSCSSPLASCGPTSWACPNCLVSHWCRIYSRKVYFVTFVDQIVFLFCWLLKDLVKVGCREHPILRLYWLYQKDPFKIEYLKSLYKWHLIWRRTKAESPNILYFFWMTWQNLHIKSI